MDYLINKVQGEIEENNKQNLNKVQNQEQYIPQKNIQPMNQNYNINNQYEQPNNEINAQPEPIA